MNYNNIIDVIQTGNNLRKVREEHFMTIEEVSIVMKGVSSQFIALMEKGKFIPTLEYIIDFCNQFNKSIDEIVISNL